ncbi:AAA family ATPase [Streptosporangium lutulentum]
MDALAPATSKRLRAQRLLAEVTSFVGRRHEVAEVKRLLSGAHVVTLTGAGGVGKTRLALRVAADVRRAFRNGVWLVELAALDEPELLVQTVAEALEIRDRSPRPPLKVLTDHLRDKQALIILDNCEHLLHDCAVMTETLVRAAPDLRVLVTSQQTLGVDGEHTLTVPPLALPDSGLVRPSTEALAQSDAVRLFAERAGAVLADFAVTDDNREAVEGICRRLDGLPLAIELAAVRLRAMSVQQLFNRLDDRFRLLTSGSRAVLPRHQTLRALIDWSYALCTDQERALWERVSVFAGDLDLEAAETVCSGDGIASGEIVDLVIGLVDKSVLVREEYPSGVRYRLLETIRQYGRDRLRESGEEEHCGDGTATTTGGCPPRRTTGCSARPRWPGSAGCSVNTPICAPPWSTAPPNRERSRPAWTWPPTCSITGSPATTSERTPLAGSGARRRHRTERGPGPGAVGQRLAGRPSGRHPHRRRDAGGEPGHRRAAGTGIGPRLRRALFRNGGRERGRRQILDRALRGGGDPPSRRGQPGGPGAGAHPALPVPLPCR